MTSQPSIWLNKSPLILGYLNAPTSVTRVLETVERFEEDLTDRAVCIAAYTLSSKWAVLYRYLPISHRAIKKIRSWPICVAIWQSMLDNLAQEALPFA